MVSDGFLNDLAAVGLCAIIRCREPGRALHIGRTLVASGVRMLEVTLTTPDATQTIRTLADDSTSGVWVGAGSVINAGDVERSIAAGAQFIVTPGVCPAIESAALRNVPSIGGAWTASEVIKAQELGATAVKIFPVSAGGPRHLKALRDPLPNVPMVAVGGVGLSEIAAYRAVGAIGFGIGSPLIGDAATGGSLTALAQRATSFVAACRP